MNFGALGHIQIMGGAALHSDQLALYRGWHALEQRLGGVDIIDFDLSTVTDAVEFTSRSQVLLALESAARSMTGAGLVSEFNRDRVQASIYYLNASLGEQIPFAEYILKTMGILPRRFSEVELLDSFDRVDTLLQEIGLRFCQSHKSQYAAQCLIQDKTTVKDQINDQLAQWLDRLGQFITVPPLNHVSVSFAEVDAYWANWVSGSVNNGFSLQINLHPRVQYLKGTPTLLAAHEYCGHLIQVQQWALNVASGKIDPSYGFTTVHSPEAFMMEGLADVLVYILADESALNFDQRLARELTLHSRLVSNNVHYLINTGHHFWDVFQYYRRYCPFLDDRTIESSIRDRSQNPLGRTYQYVYGMALDYFRQLFADTSFAQQRQMLQTLYQRPYTKTQLDRLFGLKDTSARRSSWQTITEHPPLERIAANF